MVYTNILSQPNKAVNTPKLKTYTELNCYALKNKIDKPLIIYYELRALNTTGSGFIPFSIALEKLQTIFHYSQSTVYRIFESGKGLFYEVCKSKQGLKIIRLYSLEKVSINFGITHLSIPTLIDLQGCKSRQNIRAWLYETIFKNNDYDKPIHPISHGTIKDKTGLSSLQQTRYNKIAKIKITPNFSNETTVYNGKNKQYTTARQFGNSYESNLEKGNKGQTRNINRKLKITFGKPSYRGEANEPKNDLRFYHSIKSIKGILGETYLLEKQKQNYNLWIRI